MPTSTNLADVASLWPRYLHLTTQTTGWHAARVLSPCPLREDGDDEILMDGHHRIRLSDIIGAEGQNVPHVGDYVYLHRNGGLLWSRAEHFKENFRLETPAPEAVRWCRSCAQAATDSGTIERFEYDDDDPSGFCGQCGLAAIRLVAVRLKPAAQKADDPAQVPPIRGFVPLNAEARDTPSSLFAPKSLFGPMPLLDPSVPVVGTTVTRLLCQLCMGACHRAKAHRGEFMPDGHDQTAACSYCGCRSSLRIHVVVVALSYDEERMKLKAADELWCPCDACREERNRKASAVMEKIEAELAAEAAPVADPHPVKVLENGSLYYHLGVDLTEPREGRTFPDALRHLLAGGRIRRPHPAAEHGG